MNPLKSVKTKLTPLEQQLLEALREAQEHLEYCGYGDKWERECAKEAGLEKKIKAAIDAADALETS
jgi:glutamine synthetase type III